MYGINIIPNPEKMHAKMNQWPLILNIQKPITLGSFEKTGGVAKTGVYGIGWDCGCGSRRGAQQRPLTPMAGSVQHKSGAAPTHRQAMSSINVVDNAVKPIPTLVIIDPPTNKGRRPYRCATTAAGTLNSKRANPMTPTTRPNSVAETPRLFANRGMTGRTTPIALPVISDDAAMGHARGSTWSGSGACRCGVPAPYPTAKGKGVRWGSHPRSG